MTVDEARYKTCPLMSGGICKDNMPENVAVCHTSSCMMWRWQLVIGEDNSENGYCGLAGRE